MKKNKKIEQEVKKSPLDMSDEEDDEEGKI